MPSENKAILIWKQKKEKDKRGSIIMTFKSIRSKEPRKISNF